MKSSYVKCKIPHKGFDEDKRNDPSKADLRVSDNFSMKEMDKIIKVKIEDYTGDPFEFRVRKDLGGNNDESAYGDGKQYVQDADIDLLGAEALDAANYVQRQNWTPVRSGEYGLYGHYDGNGKTVSNLYINLDIDSDQGVGLFGALGSGSSLKNVTVVSGSVFGNHRVGGVCGWNYYGTIEGCRNGAEVSARNNYIGGICGENYGVISTSHNTGAVKGSGYDVGGVCGANAPYSSIISCGNEGTVTGNSRVGGVCGYNNLNASITGSRNRADVSGYFVVGGVCGGNRGSAIVACYNTGSVSASTNQAGGVCGSSSSVDVGEESEFLGYIIACYNTGSVSPLSSYGSVCGQNNLGGISACLWLPRGGERAVGGDVNTNQYGTYSFGSYWPGEGMIPEGSWEGTRWGIYDRNGNGTADGYWKSLGTWTPGGTPSGVNSVFPKLWWEE